MIAIVFRIVFLVSLAVALVVATQDIQIFPMVLLSFAKEKGVATNSNHPQAEAFFVQSSSNVSLEAWQLRPDLTKALNPSCLKFSALLLHGNGETLESFFPAQKWFQSMGIQNVSYDYRGYGASNGWPSERGSYDDADAVYSAMLQRDGLSADRTIIFGQSIGAGPAAWLAAKYQPFALVLVSPYESIPSVLATRPLLRFLRHFLWYEFPVGDYVSRLDRTRLIIAHGERDNIIPFEQSSKIIARYRGPSVKSVFAARAHHNDVFTHVQEPLRNAIEGLCSVR